MVSVAGYGRREHSGRIDAAIAVAPRFEGSSGGKPRRRPTPAGWPRQHLVFLQTSTADSARAVGRASAPVWSMGILQWGAKIAGIGQRVDQLVSWFARTPI